ncbi:hypothetical protein [Mucilaginibacter endophyticus]|uniref:hypothetical protein n=1 Tax=Mucilaginibacter endophyticus TaxID=2675003 RepID=UPI000E0DC8A9|nr:hypothetical protein [Mucilaginibacter endophyticus]
MKLNSALLSTQEEFAQLNGTSIRGSYHWMQFVLRLRDDVREGLKSEFDFERIPAQSTAIHENIHWWQYMGSNFGLLFSLAYPAFVHFSGPGLMNLVSQRLTTKSILKFDKEYYAKHGKADLEDINFVLNNYYDLEYAKRFALNNEDIIEINKDRRFFLSIGHCYRILWSETIDTLAATLDPDYKFLPKANEWEGKFKYLNDNKIAGFYPDSPLHLTPLGIKAIYEGQAIFNQIQFLNQNLNKDLTYEDCENAGMLHGIYVKAFEFFLKVTKLTKPSNLLDPTIGLFLAICDIAINPNNGFPLDIYDLENFIVKNDPGCRFSLLCGEISKKAEHYRSKVTDYTKDEYIQLSEELSEAIGCKCSYKSIPIILKCQEHQKVAEILDEERELKYTLPNLPIKLMFSKYYRFQEDKYEYPHVLCWFGYHCTPKNKIIEFDIVNSLYKKHHALFMDAADGEIKPTIFEGRTEENIKNSFNLFYAFNILYDQTLKWVAEEGAFKFDYGWLAGERAKTFTPSIKRNFKNQWGISMDDIKIL